MGRPLRFAPAGVPLHVWCRGNQQQNIFLDDADRRRYMELLVRHATERAVRILGYCQMTNHIHLILEPSDDDGLTRMMTRLNSEHAQTVQFRASRRGHLWQGRFRAAPMDDRYLWTALRYVELNPVRAGMVERPEDWRWSSAAAHLGLAMPAEWLEWRTWSSRWDAASWAEFLGAPAGAEEEGRIRRATRENRPLAGVEAVRRWEAEYGVTLLPGTPGRPRREQPLSRSVAG
jgi:putative transposase